MADPIDPIAYHLVPVEVWAAAPPDKPFRAASLEDEGFIHLTHRMVDLVEVANLFYLGAGRPKDLRVRAQLEGLAE